MLETLYIATAVHTIHIVVGLSMYSKNSNMIKYSLMQCWGRNAGQRICKFYNLLLWNDTFYYVTSGDC